MAYHISNAAASAAADAFTALLNNGKLRIYSGTRPSTTDTTLSGNTLLAELTFGATAFGAASNGTATANAITQDSDADATGTATWFRAIGNTTNTSPGVLDGDVGVGTGDLQLNSTAIQQHAAVSVTSMTYIQSK